MVVRYKYAVDDGLTEDLVCSLAHPAEAPDLGVAERAALRFASPTYSPAITSPSMTR